MATNRGQSGGSGGQQRHVGLARAYIKSTFNNTIISLADNDGNVLCWASAGTVGFEGTKKSTPFAAQMAADEIARKARDMGVQRIDAYVRGPGSGRETAIRALESAGLQMGKIRDVTPIPHNGCRPPKRRRV